MAQSGRRLPTGTVTFLFSDIEGSTRLAHELDAATYRKLLEQHHGLLRSAFAAHGGVERGTQGDSFLVIFRDAPSAVAAATEAQRSLAAATWPGGVDVRVRMGLHSGEGIPGGDDYVGVDINRAARIASAAHGGEVLVSDSTRALAARALPAGVGVRDVGEHRLKGLAETERLHRLVIDGLPGDFPLPRGVEPGGGNLPPRLTSFLGRDEDMEALRRHLGESRLVTLVGPGGTGKTSLATEAARAAAPAFDDGAWFIGLDAIRDPDAVASAIVAGLGLRDQSGRSARDRLTDNLAVRRLLLVLDNFEQVVEAAALVGDLLVAAPAIRILVTSRAPLHLGAEQIYPVAPLSSVPSVQLFLDRARRVQPTFALTAGNAEAIAEICTRLDGLPLGIELAAARIGILGVGGLRDRLVRHLGPPASPSRDAPARQRTLHDAIAWSHDLLEPAEQKLFARLSVFAGGWRLDEAEAVSGPASELGREVVDGLSALVDQSLITTAEPDGSVRFGMLDTVREFAAEKLAPDDRSTLLASHAGAYLALVDASGPKLGGREDLVAFERVGEDWNNVMAAVRWSIDADDVRTALRLAAGLWRFWWLRGELEAGRSTIAAVLAMPGAGDPTPERMRALEALAGLHYYAGDNDDAAELYDEQLQLARHLGDVKGTADALYNLAFTRDLTGDPEAGRAFIDDIADAFRAARDEVGLTRTGWLYATLLLADGQMTEARAAMEATMARLEELDDLPYVLLVASGLALVCLQMGDQEAAVRWFLVSLVRNEERNDAAGITVALPLMAAAALRISGPEPAATILGAYDALSRRYGTRMPKRLEGIVQAFDPWVTARSALGEAAYMAAAARGAEMTVTETVDFTIETLRAVGAAGAEHGEP